MTTSLHRSFFTSGHGEVEIKIKDQASASMSSVASRTTRNRISGTRMKARKESDEDRMRFT